MRMTTADGRGKKPQDTLLPIILCLCFIGSSIIFLVQMILKSQKENVAYLYDAANQTRTSILKQIEGDWQTLEGWLLASGSWLFWMRTRS